MHLRAEVWEGPVRVRPCQMASGPPSVLHLLSILTRPHTSSHGFPAPPARKPKGLASHAVPQNPELCPCTVGHNMKNNMNAAGGLACLMPQTFGC